MTAKSEKIPSDDVEGLVWAMLDELITDEEFRRLEELLRDDEDARRIYVQCVQMHVDLKYWFDSKGDPARRMPVGLPIDLPLPTGDAPLADPAF
jgi:hypothetical protein